MNHGWVPYCGAAPVPADIAGSWNLDPLLLLVLAAAPLAYRFIPIDKRGSEPALWGAWALAIALFVSPFCPLTSALFSARSVHHLLLVIALAPLLVLSFGRVRLPASPGLWTFLAVLVFWLWHLPAAYSAALSSDSIYWLMQLSILGTAVLFWMSIGNSSPLVAIAALLGAMVATGLLGALITFAARPLYAPHFVTTQPWGLTALEDQQLAGLIMWAPGGGFYLIAAVLLAARWLGRESRAAAR
ncbi:MAG TPA: cytochrome c oxidase assembly protein [Sphingomicrobium sp.]|nr:cytochrome c oxidase assembly protein [Sphingomicrobium sp.]